MKMTHFKKMLSLLICLVLIAAMALTTIGCNDTKTPIDENLSNSTSQIEKTIKGTGATVFDFTVVDKDGKQTEFEIHTDKKTVGEALLEVGLIAGEDGPYGLYVKTVNGVTVDFDTDGKYWAFYENGAYALQGVEKTDIVTGVKYEFRAQK